MSEFGDRLREERKRLGLSQKALAEVGGVHLNAQGNYEKGARQPDSVYLAAIASAGIDVLYVLTGRRAAGENSLAPGEAALLDNYRRVTPERRASLDEVSRAFASMSEKQDNKQQNGSE